MQRALAAYRRFGTVSAACHRAKVNRSIWSRWCSTYSWFDQAVADKHADTGDELEASAIQRALAGDTQKNPIPSPPARTRYVPGVL